MRPRDLFGSSWRYCLIFTLAVFAFGTTVSAEEPVGVTVPDGFEVNLFADDNLAHDIYSLTVDAKGRVVVAGRGFVRTLIDDDGDGKADRFQQFSDVPANGAMGMFFFGNDLICTGDAGLLRLRDANGDGQADGPPDVFLNVKTGGEHDAHAIRRGPDGWWYLICGNMANVSSAYVTLNTSPVKQPEFGTILRLRPDLTGGEIFAHGFRNAYDFDFGALGDIYAYDSDDERDSSLPWYRPTRVFEVLAGHHAGWLSQSWKRPNYFLDMMPVVAGFGRGSPTGVTHYQHTQFPEPYRGCLFAMDWTFGRVMALPLQRAGEIFESKPIDFMRAKGDFGFAPTDCEIGPDGSLYIAVGGRGTRGSVFRVTHPAGLKAWREQQKKPVTDKLTLCLSTPQPLGSFARATWEPLATELGRDAFINAALKADLPAAHRVRAVEILTEKFGGVNADLAAKLQKSPSPEVRARAAWSIQRGPSIAIPAEVWQAYLTDADPLVRRSILEAVATHAAVVPSAALSKAFLAVLGDPQRFVRVAAARAVAAIDQQAFQAVGIEVRTGNWEAALSFAYAHYLRNRGDGSRVNAYAVELGRRILEAEHPLPLKLEATRLVQLGLGDLSAVNKLPAAYHGYASPLDLTPVERELDPLRVAINKDYPTADKNLNDELSRLMAVLTVFNDEALNKILAQITTDSDPIDDIHHLIVASRIPVSRGPAQRTAIAKALVNVEVKLQARKMVQDTNWPDRFTEIYATLVELDPDLPLSIIEQPEFGKPGHVIFISAFPPELAPIVHKKFLAAVKDPDYAWTNDVVFLFADAGTAEALALLRDRYEHFNTRSAALISLAKKPRPEDRPKFVEGLAGSQPEVLRASLEALEKLPPQSDPDEIVMLIKSFRRLGTEASEFPLRERVVNQLERDTKLRVPFIRGQQGYVPQPAAVQAWTDWAVKALPGKAAELQGGGGQELAELRTMLQKVDWNAGDATRGKKLFVERSCSQCHGSRQALGPSLVGVTGRFSRDDLFLAIVIPDRDVSPRYQATTIETKQGRTHTGLIVYESAEGIILRDTTNQTYRFNTSEIETKYKHNRSLMPTALLKDLKPADLADLYRFLQTQQ